MWAVGKEHHRDGERAGRVQCQLALAGVSGAKARRVVVPVPAVSFS